MPWNFDKVWMEMCLTSLASAYPSDNVTSKSESEAKHIKKCESKAKKLRKCESKTKNVTKNVWLNNYTINLSWAGESPAVETQCGALKARINLTVMGFWLREVIKKRIFYSEADHLTNQIEIQLSLQLFYFPFQIFILNTAIFYNNYLCIEMSWNFGNV